MGVEMLGFSIDPGDPNYVSPKKFDDIRGWVSGVRLVGETEARDAELIGESVKDYAFDLLQVNAPEIVPLLAVELDIPLILYLDTDLYGAAELTDIIGRNGDRVRYFVLESASGRYPGDQEAIRRLGKDHLLLSGLGEEVDPGSLEHFIRDGSWSGIAIRGGEEIRPGYKEFGVMMDILEALETE